MHIGNIIIEEIYQKPVDELEIEIVERKGLGHPDSIADGIAEEFSRRLCKEYLQRFKTILHHNVDKVLVVGGQANPRFGGGEVLSPIYILISGRATTEVRTEKKTIPIPIGTLAMEAAKEWIKRNFRFLDPEKHVIIDYRIGRGSVDLVGVFELGKRGVPLANDTSVGVGFAPLTDTERVVLETERFLNSPELKKELPEVGEDVKVMGLRKGRKLILTIAAAIISHLVEDADHYMNVKEEVKRRVEDMVVKMTDMDVEVHVNTADKPAEGIYYLTVTGTSAEHGDDGATGRGNRANGLITPSRPMSIEAAAGKNPVSHVGKIYNILAYLMAKRIADIKGVKEAYVKVLSQIGRPINDPLVVHVQILPERGMKLTSEMRNEALSIVKEELDTVTRITNLVLEGKVMVF
ncbi:MAG: methionine adenosyltransferase [Thermoprotei archaeon]|nr:MAG: methionine adenosyltransferase [Thermoprotei archaeon]